MEMSDRVKIIRQSLNKTQAEFAKMLGVGQSTLAMMEVSKRPISERHIKTICSICSINEEWLRSGEGEMLAETNDSVLAELAAEYNLEGEQLAMMRGFLMLTSEQRNAIVEAAIVIAEANKKAAAEAAKKEATAAAEEKAEPPAPAASDVDTPEDVAPDPEIEAEVARYRAKMYAKKKARMSLTSPFTEPFDTKKEPPR